MSRIHIYGIENSLPHICGGLTLRGMEVYPESNLGVSIRYQGSSSHHADAYLYDLGLPNIPQNLRSTEVLECFQNACHNVFMLADKGDYLNLKTVTSQFLHLPQDAPDPFCLWATFTYGQAPGPKVFFTGIQMSHIALRTDRGFINKVRYTYTYTYTYTEETAEAGFNSFLSFLVEWTTAVAGICQ